MPESIGGRGPDFVCIGAQKAGTTWLYDNLAVQREIWMPPEKEIHFFNTVCAHEELLGMEESQPDRGVDRYRPLLSHPSLDTLRWIRRFAFEPRSTHWYYSLFPPELAEGRKTGDITPAYSTLDGRGVSFARRVLKPGCRVILIVRNPVDRVWSGIKMMYRWKEAELPVTEVDRVLREIRHPIHRLRGDYARMVRLWGNAFGEDFRVFRYDDLVADSQRFLRSVGEFLGVEIDIDRTSLEKRSNSDPERRGIPDPLLGRLVEEFRPQVQELEQLIPGVADGWLPDTIPARSELSTLR